MTSKNNTKYLSAVMMMVPITTFILVSQEVGWGSQALRALFLSSRRGSQKKGCSRRVLLPVHFGASICQHLVKT